MHLSRTLAVIATLLLLTSTARADDAAPAPDEDVYLVRYFGLRDDSLDFCSTFAIWGTDKDEQWEKVQSAMADAGNTEIKKASCDEQFKDRKIVATCGKHQNRLTIKVRYYQRSGLDVHMAACIKQGGKWNAA